MTFDDKNTMCWFLLHGQKIEVLETGEQGRREGKSYDFCRPFGARGVLRRIPKQDAPPFLMQGSQFLKIRSAMDNRLPQYQPVKVPLRSASHRRQSSSESEANQTDLPDPTLVLYFANSSRNIRQPLPHLALFIVTV